MQKSVLITGCSSGDRSGNCALEAKRQGFKFWQAVADLDDCRAYEQYGIHWRILDLDSAESVDRAADEVIALTDNRLYGIFNHAGYGVYGPLPPSAVNEMERRFPPTSFGALAYHAPVARYAPSRRRAYRDDFIGDGIDLNAGTRRLCRQ